MAEKKGTGAIRRLKGKSSAAIDRMDKAEAKRSRKHPSTAKAEGSRKKAKASSMAPREGGKKKHYGRPFDKA